MIITQFHVFTYTRLSRAPSTHKVGRCNLSDILKHRCTSSRLQSVIHRELLALCWIGILHCECPVVIGYVGCADDGAAQSP